MKKQLKIQDDITILRLETQRMKTENNFCWVIIGGILLFALIISLI